MRLNKGLDRIFPDSFAAKAFSVAFVGTHVPLLATIGYALFWRAEIQVLSATTLIILCATLIGTIMTLGGIWALLAPLREIESALSRYEADGHLPFTRGAFGRDEIGRLADCLLRMSERISRRMDVVVEAAESDPLTGLLNRRGFEARFVPGMTAAVLYLDLDGFKKLNDTMGHEAGDKVLRMVADALRQATRPVDGLARLGGDEFVVIMPDLPPRYALDVAERVRASVEALLDEGDGDLSVSIGLSLRTGQKALDEAIRQADAAMLDAKRAGKNRVALHEDFDAVLKAA